MRSFALAVGALALWISPVVYSQYTGRSDSERLRAEIVPGMDWVGVAGRVAAKPLFMQSISFWNKNKRCAFVWVRAADHERSGEISLSLDSPTQKSKAPEEIKLQSLADKRLTAMSRDCSRVKLDSHERFGFSHFGFAVVFGPDGKVVSTDPTEEWD